MKMYANISKYVNYVLALAIGLIYLAVNVVWELICIIETEISTEVLMILAHLNLQLFKMVDDLRLQFSVEIHNCYSRYIKWKHHK